MGNLIVHNGIGISTATGNRFFDVAALSGDAFSAPAQEIPQTILAPTISRDFALWGADNQLPAQMVKDIEGCGILNSIIDSQARFALGKGVIWAYVKTNTSGEDEVVEICQEKVILDFMRNNNHYAHEFGLMRDLIGINHGMVRFVLDGQRKNIVQFLRDDVTEMRYGLMNQDGNRAGKIDNVYLCSDWSLVSDTKNTLVRKVVLIDENRALQDLEEKVAQGNDVIFAITFRNPGWNKKYYPLPNWYSAKLWVDIAKQIPAMKKAMFEHNFRPRYLITILPEFWTNHFQDDGTGKSWEDYSDKEIEGKRQEVYNDIDQHLMGVDNHGKAIFVDGFIEKVSGKLYSEIEIKPIDDTIKQGDMLPDSANANSEISFAMRFNPAILGASLPSGPYTNSQGGSNVREAGAMQVITMEPERQHIMRIYELFARFNKWDELFAKDGLTLKPIIPTTVLTTLDTGGSTKPVVNGADPKQKAPNTQPPITEQP